MAILTEAQAIILILRNRKFKDTDIERLTGIHRVTINNIRHGNYSGSTSLKYLEVLIKKLTDITKDELMLLEAAYYHRNINLPETNHKQQKLLPSPTIQQPTLANINDIIETFDTVPNNNAYVWFHKRGTCTICKNRIGGSFVSGYIKHKFVVACEHCTQQYSEYITPNPTK